MKIYNKQAFVFGIFCAGGLLFFALGVIPADWWQWGITLAIAGRYLYLGLSKTAGEQEAAIGQKYKETAVKLYGKYAFLKTHLPIFLLAAFFVTALAVRFVFDCVPVWFAAVFCVVLMLSAAYSMGLERSIRNAVINEKKP
ncbi:MAG: hypothetical protein HFG00_03500 [Oscillibacter sp.]|nr:hypothetical protein [Oscillibacter sp.]